jgi:hypothetical protein
LTTRSEVIRWQGPVTQTGPTILESGGFFMSKADDRAFLRQRHAAFSDRIAELKALPTRTGEQKIQLNDAIEGCQFIERELENFKG